jgi:uncharacterized protein (DUF2062 family)
MSRLQGVLRAVLSVEDRPRRVALAFAIGVFIAFFPALGIHTGLALVLAFYFRLNRVAILAGAWINNPWTLAPMYMAGTAVGCAIIGVSPEDLRHIDWHLHGRAFYRALWEGLRPYLLPFVVGNLVLGMVSGVVAYAAVLSLLERRRRGQRPRP